jgi:exodeoxyribonuclease VII small subunit
MNKKQFNFKKSLKRLETIVLEIENTDSDIDKVSALFAEGVELVKFCSAKLNDTKKKIEIISSSGKTELFKG